MKIKSLLVASAVLAVAAGANAFEWSPVVVQPNPNFDVTAAYQIEDLKFHCYNVDGVSITDVMPVWLDEDGKEIKAVSGLQNPDGWDTTEFSYKFNLSDFKSNGEYILLFPEGLLVNASGDKSAKVELPYTFDVTELAPAMFDDFKVISVSPDLTQPQGMWADQIITVNTNHNDAIGLTKLILTDLTADEVMTTSTNFTTGRGLGDSEPITWEIVGTFKFMEDHNYKAELVFYNGSDEYGEMGEVTPVVDKITYEFIGKGESYKYSDVVLESVTPEPDSFITIPELAVFKYVFSAPVNVYKAETPLGSAGMNVYPPSCLSSNEDKTEWTLDLSDDSFVLSQDASIIINIYARDMDGYQLKGNQGVESDACYSYEWECELGATPIEVVSPASGAEIDRLTEVVVKSANGEPMSWTWLKSATVLSNTQEILGTLVCDVPEDAEDTASVEFTFTKWTTSDGVEEPIDLTKAGTYAIHFDHGCFVFGEQFDSKVSHSVTSMFTITGNETPDDPVIDPAEQEVFNYDRVAPEAGSTVTSLSLIQLWYPEMVTTMGEEASVYNKADETLVTKASVEFSWDDVLLVDVRLMQPITEAGEYEVVIPNRTICTDEFFMNDGNKGICNPEIRLVYTVDPDGSAVVSVAESSENVVYDLNGRIVLRNASSAAVNALPKGIYVVGGRKLVVK